MGLSALLTTTMVNMEATVKAVREMSENTEILIGGAPVTVEFCRSIGASYYSPYPQGAVNYLSKLVTK
jgi:5-methyltetrahydrofolate--homocysteine methyltransferase